MNKIFYSLLALIIVSGLIAVFGDVNLPSIGNDTAEPKIHTVIPIDSTHKPGQISYINDVKPILDKRCVGCHAGYDAPCQLKLASFEGLLRGATKQRVLGHFRLDAIKPTRLFIDETTAAGWREQGFFSVLNEKAHFPEINLNHSLLAKFVALKANNPLSPVGKLPAAIVLDDADSWVCPNLDEVADFQNKHPLSGMPYALPPLTDSEQSTLLNWLQDGAKASVQAAAPSALALTEIKKWEQFFNDNPLKSRLSARYLYEHLYSGDLHFKDQPADEFYKLVRSKTPPGQAIDELKTVRPTDAPGLNTFYYRLRPVVETVVDKNHIVYELSDSRMERFKTLFLKPEFAVTALPAYDGEAAANPFKTFRELPAASRYQFLLDDAGYFMAAVVKTPAFAHNTIPIQDQLWIAFSKPQLEQDLQYTQFLADNSEVLQLPATEVEGTGFSAWHRLYALQQQYLVSKQAFSTDVLLKQQTMDLNRLWDGDGNNPNALLSVFRHNDNASVVRGLLGKIPLTAWVLDYPLFERMQYALAAGFNVYGSARQHISVRWYMYSLRQEAESNFLQFMPKSARKDLYDSGQQSADMALLSLLGMSSGLGIDKESAISYQTSDYKTEFFEQLRQYAAAAGQADVFNRCIPSSCPVGDSAPEQQRIDRLIRKLADMQGDRIAALPELAFLRIKMADPEKHAIYTLIRNKKRPGLPMLVAEQLGRGVRQDTLTVIAGLTGSYPNVFFDVYEGQLENFIEQLQYAQTAAEIDSFYSRYGVRRNNPEIWAYYDWINKKYRADRAEQAGLFDLSHYGNF
ncbi:MAG: fatty acid cis/trans isomerase [Methylovulum sp.]|nr:fatty acid cis/trans isomerase [Methylovulum sp.]